jgi:hypothetical protein
LKKSAASAKPKLSKARPIGRVDWAWEAVRMISRRRIGHLLAALAFTPVAFGPMALAAPDDDDAPPNVFISPCGKPFRAHITDPYPVALWFKEADKNGDGKLDRSEFLADAEAFFAVLDVNGDGVIDSREVSRYEHNIAPEVIGYRVSVSDLRGASGLYGGKLWRAQIQGNAPIAPEEPQEPKPPHDIDESGQGASPYGFFAEPEPVMAADENLNGRIRKAAFLRLAGRHFDRLDTAENGYLTLDKLPKTGIQLRVERVQRHGRRS